MTQTRASFLEAGKICEGEGGKWEMEKGTEKANGEGKARAEALAAVVVW